ncbi:MAG: pyridoxamine 5-phosphate oxidase, partial [Tabrizicola sp.]
ADNAKASLFFMDYANKARLKLLGRIRPAPLAEAPQVLAALTDPKLQARAEHLLIVTVEAFDWNCPQYIEPRYTASDIAPAIKRLQGRIAELEAALTRK